MSAMTAAEREAALKIMTDAGVPLHQADQMVTAAASAVGVSDEDREYAGGLLMLDMIAACGGRILAPDGRDVSAELRRSWVAGMKS